MDFFQTGFDWNYVKINVQMKSIKLIALPSDSAIILTDTETDRGIEKSCPSDSPNHHHLRNLFFSDIYVPSNIVCWNKDFLIQMKLTLLNIDNQHQTIASLAFNKIKKKSKQSSNQLTTSK